MINRDIETGYISRWGIAASVVNTDDSLKWKKDTKNLISTDDHLTWLHSRFADPFTQIWIALHDGTLSGQVRLEKKVILFTWIFMLSQKRGDQVLPVSR